MSHVTLIEMQVGHCCQLISDRLDIKLLLYTDYTHNHFKWPLSR